MGRAKMCVDEGDIPNFLAMNGDVLQNREDTTELKGDMEDLRKDVHAIHLKQDAIAKVVTGVQAAISVPIQQLATMADVLKSFVIQSIQCVWPYISMLPSSKFDWATAMKFLKFYFGASFHLAFSFKCTPL